MSKKVKEFKLPKYLKLNQGLMWIDDISGIKLYRAGEQFIGRGCKENSKVPLDKNSNQSFTHMDYGYIELDSQEDKSYFCTDEVQPEKLTRILTAFQNNILVEYDPSKPSTTEKGRKIDKNFIVNKDGDYVFNGKNDDIYRKLNALDFEKLKEFIKSCGEKQRIDLVDMYHYEVRGYNPLNRSRFEVLNLIREKLNSFGPHMTPIRMNEDPT
jgi:hypothetical protein